MSTVSPPYTKKKLGANFQKKNSEKSAEQTRETDGTISFNQHFMILFPKFVFAMISPLFKFQE